MNKSKNASAWTEQGYALFAEEGRDGIQVERLARMLQLNKSGFYHYFGDMEVYGAEMLKLHDSKVDHFLRDVKAINSIDPEYLLLLIKHAPMVMFQVQLTRGANNPAFYHASEMVDQKVDLAVRRLWGDFFGLQRNSELAQRCHYVVRDMFYARMNAQRLTYEFLHNFVTATKRMVTQLKQQQLLETNDL